MEVRAHGVCPQASPCGEGTPMRSGCRGGSRSLGAQTQPSPHSLPYFSCPDQRLRPRQPPLQMGATRWGTGPGPSTVEGDPQGSQPSPGLPVCPTLCFSFTLTGEAKGSLSLGPRSRGRAGPSQMRGGISDYSSQPSAYRNSKQPAPCTNKVISKIKTPGSPGPCRPPSPLPLTWAGGSTGDENSARQGSPCPTPSPLRTVAAPQTQSQG